LGLVAIVIVGIVVIGWLLSRGPIEGFQTQPFRMLNVPYNKETYLVGVPDKFTSPTWTNGYTYAEAQAKCKSLGGDLATVAQLTTAQQLGAEWCSAAGWVRDNQQNLYYPSQNSNTNPRCVGAPGTCQNGAAGTNCLKMMAVPSGGKGFANCYGTKPPTATAEFGVQWFAPLNPSVFDISGISLVLSGDGKLPDSTGTLIPDLFTQQITPDQALYALERNSANWRQARKYIVDNWSTLNNDIRGTDPTPQDNENVDNWKLAKLKSCQTLDTIQTDIITKHNTLKGAYAYLKRLTAATADAKGENMNLQREIAYVCRGMTADTSPACKRLAELDFTTFYQNLGTGNFFPALDNLNGMLAARECEMLTGVEALQFIMEKLNCAQEALPFKTAILGDSKDSAGNYYDCTAPTANTAAYEANFPNRFTRDSIGFIPSEELKKALEEISPFFNSPGYEKLFSQTLNQLSVLLSIPQLNDYATAKQNIALAIPNRALTIQKTVNSVFNIT